jgi:hypothetical protein
MFTDSWHAQPFGQTTADHAGLRGQIIFTGFDGAALTGYHQHTARTASPHPHQKAGEGCLGLYLSIAVKINRAIDIQFPTSHFLVP